MAHTTESSRKTSLVKTGGSLGIAGTLIALAIFLMGMFGFGAVFLLAMLPVGMGLVGIILAIVGAVQHTHHGNDEVQPLAALFVSFMSLIGGLILLHFWYHWPK